MRRIFLLVAFFFAAVGALATVFGTVRGIIHDPQHRPVPDIKIVLKALVSDYSQTTQTDASGEFHFDAVPLGEYVVNVSDSTFVADELSVTVLSGTSPILHLELK